MQMQDVHAKFIHLFRLICYDNSHNDIIYWSTSLICKYMWLPLMLLAFMVGLAVGYICSYDIVVVCIAHFVSLQ